MTGKRGNGEGSIYPFRNGYAAYAWITTPDGRRQRKYVYGKTREIVHQKWTQLTVRARQAPISAKVPKLSTWLDRWLTEVVRPGLAPATAANYAMFARLYIAPDLGSKRLDKLSVREVQTWMNALKVRCQCCAQEKDAARSPGRCCAVGQCCRQVASSWTIHQAWTVLRSALAHAVREELVTRNVAALVRVPLPRPPKPRPWTVEESRQFLENAREAEDPFYVAYVLALLLGMRRGEVLGLSWADVDFTAGELRVGWQLQRIEGRLMRRTTKTASSEAPLPLPGLCARALEAHRARQDAWRVDAGEAWQEVVPLVVTTRLGNPVDPRNFHRAFKERCAAAGVPAITVHATRRTCASLLVALDVHPRVAMQILRHSQIAVTMNVYSDVASNDTRAALLRLGDHLGATG